MSFSHSLEYGMEVLGGMSAVPRARSQLLWMEPVHTETVLMLLADLAVKKLQLVVEEVCSNTAQSKTS